MNAFNPIKVLFLLEPLNVYRKSEKTFNPIKVLFLLLRATAELSRIVDFQSYQGSIFTGIIYP